MARLDDLLPELKDDVLPSTTHLKSVSGTSVGKKRRAWLVEDESSDSKGSMNPIHKPLYTKVISRNADDSKGSINQVYKPNLCFEDLRSNPLKLFRYLFELTQRAGDDCKTPRVKIGDMMLKFNMSKDSARTALRFLLKQKFIERIEFQAGSMGWSRYQLSVDVYKELERGLSKGFMDPFNESPRRGEDNLSADGFGDAWDEVDFSGLESIGFNKKHFLQLKNKTSPEVVQESINHFIYGLVHNKKTQAYPNPLATLISVLKRGEFWVEPNYQSAQELAKAKLLEIKKAELERTKVIEEELYKVAFEEWQQNLSKEDRESLAPDTRKRGDMTPPLVKLSAYFRENLWPEKRENL